MDTLPAENPPQIAPQGASTPDPSPTPANGVNAPNSPQSGPTPARPVRNPNAISAARRKDGYQVPHDELKRETAKMLYLQSVALAQIANATGVPFDTIRKWITRGRWREVRTALQEQTRQNAVVVVQQGLSAVSKTLRADLAAELQSQADALKKRPCKTVSDLRSNPAREGRARVVKTLAEAASIVCGWEDEAKIGLIVPMVDAPAPILDVESDAVPAGEPGAPIITGSDAVEPGERPAG